MSEVFSELIREGLAEWTSASKSEVYIYWRKPEDWGNLVYQWVNDGGMLGTILTIYEIVHGDSSKGQGGF